ncbi:uncharacterized protein UV8b_08275 [Ustilaginoidea virens]|uniref:CENP-C homolog n=1 Tax=Ustilaginoidea virens TaxID=1159556 RepID=A0A8E5HYJ8_USTVR|nr:uncharacterized protein UV8b_08275 [Ustilaginoidea virens]QUC24034.1 hypothetical protein UV8b_08275 [Ustilaginoidea virens]
MARSAKRPRTRPQALHQLGVRGRKTGVVLRDRGERDEHGMQPLDAIFSPHEGQRAPGDESSDAGSGDMEIASSEGPGPQTILRNRHSITHPLPKSRSPAKTKLKSPAEKTPRLDRSSSPSRSQLTDDRDLTVTRKLDFSTKGDRPRRSSAKRISNVSTSSRRSSRLLEQQQQEEEEELEEEELEEEEEDGEPVSDIHPSPLFQKDPTVSDLVTQSMQMVDAIDENMTAAGLGQGAQGDVPPTGGDDYPEDEPPGVPSPAEPPSLPKSSPALPPPPKPSRIPPPTQSIYSPKKRPPLEMGDEPTGSEDEQSRSEAKRRRTKTRSPLPPRAPKAPLIPKSKPAVSNTAAQQLKRGRGRPPKAGRRATKPSAGVEAGAGDDGDDDGEGDETFMEIQRGPPMPRSRGLVSLRNDGGALATQARLGRRPARPRDYWTGDIREYDDEHDKEELPVKEVIRLPADAPPSSRAPHSKTRAKVKATIREAVQEDEELEDWEVDEGTVTGEIVLWEAAHELDPPGDDDEVQVTEERLAIAADAIETHDNPNTTFRFAKLLTLPFIGAGVVDLPPEAEKRPKNSRKMHLVFFVHYGKVLVTINEVQFRISAGGTWFVPRGNYYSITNDYQVPARIFFAQGCEVAPAQG